MELIKHTEIVTATNKYDIAVINIFGSYHCISFFGKYCSGECFSELNRAIEEYERNRKDTIEFVHKKQETPQIFIRKT